MRSGSGYSSPDKIESRLEALSSEILSAQHDAEESRSALDALHCSTKLQIQSALNALEKCAGDRLELLQSSMRKVCVYVSSRFANGQYDVQMLSTMLVGINRDLDLNSFILEHDRSSRVAVVQGNISINTGEKGKAHGVNVVDQDGDQDGGCTQPRA